MMHRLEGIFSLVEMLRSLGEVSIAAALLQRQRQAIEDIAAVALFLQFALQLLRWRFRRFVRRLARSEQLAITLNGFVQPALALGRCYVGLDARNNTLKFLPKLADRALSRSQLGWGVRLQPLVKNFAERRGIGSGSCSIAAHLDIKKYTRLIKRGQFLSRPLGVDDCGGIADYRAIALFRSLEVVLRAVTVAVPHLATRHFDPALGFREQQRLSGVVIGVAYHGGRLRRKLFSQILLDILDLLDRLRGMPDIHLIVGVEHPHGIV